jgi:hypothetical protein
MDESIFRVLSGGGEPMRTSWLVASVWAMVFTAALESRNAIKMCAG